MTPVKFPQANASFKSPNGYDESQVATIPAYVGQLLGGNCDGDDIIIVAWLPSPEEVADIASGKPIFLSVLGGLPPHSLSTAINFIGDIKT
jgi:hypothetical protein